MKDKLFLFPALILVLTPCVWYSNQLEFKESISCSARDAFWRWQ